PRRPSARPRDRFRASRRPAAAARDPACPTIGALASLSSWSRRRLRPRVREASERGATPPLEYLPWHTSRRAASSPRAARTPAGIQRGRGSQLRRDVERLEGFAPLW